MYYGDYPEDHTKVVIPFNTFTSDDPSASCTITNLAAGDIKIHKDGGVAQKASSNGITVSINFDGITGNHLVIIDTSDDTGAAGFWVAGHEYEVRMEGTTVDGATINAFIGAFSIERTGGALALLKAGTVDVNTKTITDGIITAAKLGADCITNAKIADDAIAAENIKAAAIDNATFAADVGSTAYATNIIALAVRKALDEINLDHLLKVAVSNRDTLPEVVDDTILANILTKTDGDTSDFDHSTDSLEAIRDRGDAAWITGAGGSDRLLMVDTTIATLASQTSFTLTAGSSDDNAYNNCTIVIEDSATATQKAVGLISDYTGGTKTITLKYDPSIFTMAVGDKVYILAENALKATLANRQLNVAADGDIAGNIDGSVASLVGHTVQTGDSFARIGAPVGASISADIASNKSELDGLQGTDGKCAISTDAQDLSGSLDVNAKTVGDKTGYALSAAGNTAVIDDFETQSQADPTGFHVNVKEVNGTAQTANDNGADINAILIDTNELQTDDIPGKIAALNNLSAAQVNAEVVDALATDTYAEPGQEAPGATVSLAKKISYLYKFLRNKITDDGTNIKVYNDAGAVVDQKAGVSEAGGTVTRAEFGTGP